MLRTNVVVGTTAPPGSGAQRCAQAGEREHRTDSTAGTATATAASATAHKAKHYCRNLRCRSKLPAPVENEHRAFCTRGCFESFYRSRCLVCEEPMRRKVESQRFGSGHAKCRAERRRFPHVYDWPERLKAAQTSEGSPAARGRGRSAHFTGLKTRGLADRPSRDLGLPRGWRWETPTDWQEHLLLDRDGKLVARLWLVGERWYLLRRRATPLQSSPDPQAAKKIAAGVALAALPIDAATAANVERANTNARPYLPRRPRAGTTYDFKIKRAEAAGDPGPIPDFLNRALVAASSRS
jgi:hypothetical protein